MDLKGGIIISFKDIKLKVKYTSYDDDLIKDFYNPVLTVSKRYDRAVGYFSSTALLAYIKGVRALVNNNGRLRLIISPILTNNDFDAMTSLSMTEELTKKMFDNFIQDKITFKSSQLLYLLLKKGILDIKVAKPLSNRGMFHDKIGVFFDNNNNMIAISGSNNETITALKYNTESFDIFQSWIPVIEQYVIRHRDDFNRYWNNEIDNLQFIDIKEVLKSDYLEKFETDDTIDELYDYILKEEKSPEKQKLDFTPWENQIKASESWFEKKRGILEMATGTGKTKTAIYIHEQLKEQKKQLFTIIVVPDITLINQWEDELKYYNKDILMAYSKTGDWHIKFKDLISIYQFDETVNPLIIATTRSFYTKRFQRELRKLKGQYFLIVDEMHGWGTKRILSSLPKVDCLLGLSATPHNYFNEEKTEELFEYFGGIVYSYTLAQAIKDKVLIPYTYNPLFVTLTEQEKINYNKLTRSIVKLYGVSEDKANKKVTTPMLEMLLFKRARIVYGANNKLIKLAEVIEEIEKKGRLVVYAGITSEKEVKENTIDVEDSEAKDEVIFLKQIDQVGQLLNEKQIRFSRYTSNESESERLQSITAFENQTYSTLLAIKCLDEGVDIPSIERAIILSSSTNPREFIQRRGRILRKSSKTNKTQAEIYDFVLLEKADETSNYNSLNTKELERYKEFARLALNKDELLKNYTHLEEKYLTKGEEDYE